MYKWGPSCKCVLTTIYIILQLTYSHMKVSKSKHFDVWGFINLHDLRKPPKRNQDTCKHISFHREVKLNETSEEQRNNQ